jgi:hypothetical protein
MYHLSNGAFISPERIPGDTGEEDTGEKIPGKNLS